jgi:hypothetical protein
MLSPGVITEAGITDAAPRKFEDNSVKLVIQLDNSQALVLNQTRLRQMIAAFGLHYDKWCGQKIRYWRGTAMYQGKPVAAIAIEPIVTEKIAAESRQALAPPAPPEPDVYEDVDEAMVPAGYFDTDAQLAEASVQVRVR